MKSQSDENMETQRKVIIRGNRYRKRFAMSACGASHFQLWIIAVVTIACTRVYGEASSGKTGPVPHRFGYLNLSRFEPKEQEAQFREFELSDRVVYYRQRQIGRGPVQAIVQGEFVAYHFERGTGQLIDFQLKWRNNLPEVLPDIIDQPIAEAATLEHLLRNRAGHGQRPLTASKIRFAGLYYLSEDSQETMVRPVPTNPCWIVETEQDGVIRATIVDAVESRVVGEAIPPPGAEGFSLTGPLNLDTCTSGWTSWYLNAKYWFDRLGYLTDAVQYPTQTRMIEEIQSLKTSVFYELAHGGSTNFANGCGDSTTASEVSNWLVDSPAMPFMFLGSCDGMCSTGPGTLSHAFRKGSTVDTATVGYCGMSNVPCVDSCWYAGYSISWQTRLFDLLNQGKTMQEAFDRANADYPGCGTNSCMRFVGDPTLTLVPTILRGRIIRLEGDLTFGNVIPGQTSQRTLTIYNDGNSALTISEITYPSGFSGAWSGTIAKNGSQSVTVTFAPEWMQNYSGMITVNSDKTSGTNTIICSGTAITYIPPSTPTLSSPVNGATDLSVTPLLQVSSFSDPDGDSHANSHWQIDNNSDFSSPEWDSGDTYPASTQVTVPSGRLNYLTTYLWRVRYKDSREAWSSWSSSWSFTTTPPVGTYSGGSGTEAEPYQVSTLADWQELITASADWNKHFVLMNDIDLAGVTIMPVVADPNEYFGMGFIGTFEGNGHVLRNVVINLPNSDDVGLFSRLVSPGQIRNLGVENIVVTGLSCVGGLSGSNVRGTISNCYATGMVTGGSSSELLGGLCGYNHEGTISGCYATGAVEGSQNVGGLCGVNEDGTISNCYATGPVSGSYRVGGLCGRNYQGAINSCYATGEVTQIGVWWPPVRLGGLCGEDDGIITACFWDMETSGRTTSDGGTGKTTAELKTLSTFMDAVWDFSTTWLKPAGGYPRLLWEVDSGSLQVTILPSEAAAEGAQWRRVGTTDWLDSGQIETSIPAVAWDVEFKPTTHWISPKVVQVLISPTELTQVEATYTHFSLDGMGTDADPYRISTVADWQKLIVATADWDKHFVLLNDIDFGGASLTPVAPDTIPDNSQFDGMAFTGVFDGNGHVVSNAVIILPGSDYVGLFGLLRNPGLIRDLGVENIVITGDDYVGGLCGFNGVTISGCYATGAVTGRNDVGGLCGRNEGTIGGCYATGSVTGGDTSDDLGGLCGLNYNGLITNCYATGNVAGGSESQYLGGLCGQNSGGGVLKGTISGCHAMGRVTAGINSSYLGGLCGLNRYRLCTISNCYAAGTVDGGSNLGGLCGYINDGLITNCYATGPVSGRENVGGLCGNRYAGTIKGSFWDIESSGQTTSAGEAVGKTSAQMKMLSMFTSASWDFVGETANETGEMWRMCEDGVDYPRLAWEFSQGGDFDCPDGVGMDDLLYLAGRWLVTIPPNTSRPADANNDGQVNLSDFAILAGHWMERL